MSSSNLWRFVLKDLYFTRPLIIAALVVALLAVPLMSLGSIGQFSAMILMVVAGAAPSSFICMTLIQIERKERTLLFALSLPISAIRATQAKMLAASISYLVPWLLMACGTFALFALTHAPRGTLPFGTMLWLFLLDQFCLMLVVTVVSSSEALSTATIIVCNVSISFYFFTFLHFPVFAAHLPDRTAVWSAPVLNVIAVELAVAVLLVAAMLWRVSRRHDFI